MFEAEAVEQSESEQTVNGPLLHTGTVTCFLGMHGGYMWFISGDIKSYACIDEFEVLESPTAALELALASSFVGVGLPRTLFDGA